MVFEPGRRFIKEKCTGCGICSSLCPASAIQIDDIGKVTSFISTCIGCSHCGCFCPSNCFNLPLCEEDKLPSSEQIQNLFQSRRSIRKFTDREIDEAVLNSLLETVGFSPTGQNAQGITVEVILGREKINQLILSPLVKIVKLLDCFRLLTLIAGKGGGLVKKLRNGEDLINWNAPCVLLFRAPLSNPTAKTDSIIAATMVSLKAETLGLGTFWNGVVQMASMILPVKKCHAALCVGYPALKKYQNVLPREWMREDKDISPSC